MCVCARDFPAKFSSLWIGLFPKAIPIGMQWATAAAAHSRLLLLLLAGSHFAFAFFSSHNERALFNAVLALCLTVSSLSRLARLLSSHTVLWPCLCLALVLAVLEASLLLLKKRTYILLLTKANTK